VRCLVDGQFDPTEVVRCDKCAWEIACADYHPSLLRKKPAPPYEPEAAYRSFVELWPLAQSTPEKMLLIDQMIHEWHLHYRAVGWPLGTAVVQATAGEMIALLESLACGPGSTPGLAETDKQWRSRLAARRMRFDLQAAARDLGIEGAGRMRKVDLLRAIEAADPRFFELWFDLVYGRLEIRPWYTAMER
jgi:hypothetical protein